MILSRLFIMKEKSILHMHKEAVVGGILANSVLVSTTVQNSFFRLRNSLLSCALPETNVDDSGRHFIILGSNIHPCHHESSCGEESSCLYGHTYSKSMNQPGKVANPARGQLNREN